MKKRIKATTLLLLFSYITTISAFGQTMTQMQIENATLGTQSIIIDGYVWRVAIKKTHTDGKKYAMLYAIMGSPHENKRFGGTNDYNSSEVRIAFTNEYAKSTTFTNLKQIAVVATMNNGPGLTNTARTALPTNPPLAAESSATQDVIFLPTMQDVKDWQSTWNVAATFANSQRLITRNPYQTSPANTLCAFISMSSSWLQDDAGIQATNANATGILLFRPCIWVRVSSLDYTVTYDGNGNTGGSAPAGGTYSEGSNVAITGQGTLIKTGYKFAGWKYGATIYQAGNTFIMPATNVIFIAQWTLAPVSTHIITNKNNSVRYIIK
jgi:hypothetical protein